MAVNRASIEIPERAGVPPVQARAIVQAIELGIAGAKETVPAKQNNLILRHEMLQRRVEVQQEMARFRQDIADLRHSIELKLDSMITRPQLYGAILGQAALLFAIAYVFVNLQH